LLLLLLLLLVLAIGVLYTQSIVCGGCRTVVTETWCFRWLICQVPRDWQCPSLKHDVFIVSTTLELYRVSAVLSCRRFSVAKTTVTKQDVTGTLFKTFRLSSLQFEIDFL